MSQATSNAKQVKCAWNYKINVKLKRGLKLFQYFDCHVITIKTASDKIEWSHADRKEKVQRPPAFKAVQTMVAKNGCRLD